MPCAVHVFGVRHHGPGSARSLRVALQSLQPDCVLVEGPPDADGLIALAADAGMRPPVALLVYAADNPRQAVVYPFAVFSPEWQAIQYGLSNHAAVRFMDLPLAMQFVLDELPPDNASDPSVDPPGPADAINPQPEEPLPAATPNAPNGPQADPEADPQFHPQSDPLIDPLQHLAHAAGYADAEEFWEQLVEARADDRDVFPAIMEAMCALREQAPLQSRREMQREAFMRRTIREARKEGFQRIAVVCGAWHAPALAPENMPPTAADSDLLTGLKKIKTASAWAPWTHGRLTSASGYGAGISSPGYYHHLWNHMSGGQNGSRAITWLTRVARLLREADIDCSSAHIIEAVRLATAVAAMRQRSAPALRELNEATQTVMTFGNPTPLALIHQKLIVSETMGRVSETGPVAPLLLDLQKTQKRLRLPPDPAVKTLELDLRKANDLAKSEFLGRLQLLGVPWGHKAHADRNARGTFKETWQIQWQPEFVVRLIEQGIFGNSVYDAASGWGRRTASETRELPTLTELLNACIHAGLLEAVGFLLRRVQDVAAVAADVSHMLAALPALAGVIRYGDVRQTDPAMVTKVFAALVERAVISLPLASASLNDEAAAALTALVEDAHSAIALVCARRPEQPAVAGDEQIKNKDAANAAGAPDLPELSGLWTRTLRSMSDARSLHGLLVGRITRLLLDAGHISQQEMSNRLGLALSLGAGPAAGASFLEGFLRGGGQLLLHNPKLLAVLNQWVAQLTADHFTAALPLVRRTFSMFPAPERRQLARALDALGGASGPGVTASEGSFDAGRAATVLPVLRLLLGISSPTETA